MDRLIDEILIFVLCLIALSLYDFANEVVVGCLLSICIVCAADISAMRSKPPWLNVAVTIVIVGYVILGCVAPVFIFFLPVVSYAASIRRLPVLQAVTFLPIAIAFFLIDTQQTHAFLFATPYDNNLRISLTIILAIQIIALLLGHRTRHNAEAQTALHSLRDELQGSSYALIQQNQRLQDLHELELRCAVLDERARIAREIHDNVGHLLTRSMLQVDALSVVHTHEPLQQDLTSLRDTLEEAMNTIRRSVHDLHADAFDIRTQLETMANRYTPGQATVVFDCGPMPQAISSAIASVVGEALSNAAKHGNADYVRIRVNELPGLYQVLVEDNGMGVQNSTQQSAEQNGLGLLSMRERIEALGGSFNAHPREQAGFIVFASIPKQMEVANGSN